jgi:hypothetical protein
VNKQKRYILLNIGEVTQKGDEFYYGGSINKWQPVMETSLGLTLKKNHLPIRRNIKMMLNDCPLNIQ